MKYILLLLFIPLGLFSQLNDEQVDSLNQKKSDSLLIVIKNEKNDTSKINLYIDLIRVIDPIEKKSYYNDILYKLSKEKKNDRGMAFYYKFSSTLYWLEGKNGLDYARKSAEIFKKIKDYGEYIHVIENQMVSFLTRNNEEYEEAIKLLNENLVISKKMNDDLSTARQYLRLGVIYQKKDEKATALKYCKKSQYFYNKCDPFAFTRGELYKLFSIILSDLKRFDEALYYINLVPSSLNVDLIKASIYNDLKDHERALDILLKHSKSEKINTIFFEHYYPYKLAETYYYLKRYEDAIYSLNKIIIINIKENEELLITYNLLSKCYMGLNENKQAYIYNEQALKFKDSTPISSVSKIDVLLTKSKIEENLGNYKKALSFFKQYKIIEDEQNLKLNNEKILELQNDFGVAEKNYRIKDLQLKQLTKDRRIKKQRTFIIAISIGFIMIFIALFAFIKLNKALKLKNEIIDKNSIALEKSNREKETLLKEIHHRVKNNLQLVMSLLYVQSKQKDINIDYFIEVSQSRIISMALIHENLYQTSDLSKVDYREYCNNLAQSILTAQNDINKEIQLNVEVDAVFLDVQIAIPIGLIINELVNNAFKHAFKNHSKGIINLVLRKKNEEFELEISDNGVGIPENEIENKSLGLELVKQLVNQIQGFFQADNNFGVHYYIKFKNEIV